MSKWINDIGIQALIGRHVLSARINEERNLVVLDTDKGALYLTWEGDCCANCFLAGASGTEALVGATILSAENAEWKNLKEDQDDGEVLDSMGTNIKTTKGHVSLESRVEHNGYYGGKIHVSDDEPMNTYHNPRYVNRELPALKLLEDF